MFGHRPGAWVLAFASTFANLQNAQDPEPSGTSIPLDSPSVHVGGDTMRKLCFGLAAAALFAVSTVANAQVVWQDHFDTYALGPLAAQSPWEEWYTSTNVDADVVQDFAFTGTKSVKITG